METILKVRDLKKSYQDFSLDHVSFTIPKGCITGFIGVNGAGKSTTIRSILGLAMREGGTVELFGKEFNGTDSELKNRIGVVLDDHYFYEELTIAQMKSIVAPAYHSWCESKFRDYLNLFQLNPEQTIATLSKGMRMKFALSLALSHKAELLIMDEPTGGLDPLIRSQVLDLLSDYMKKEGRGVFFSTHVTSDLDKIADLLVLIDHGKILFEQDKDTLLDEYRCVKGDKNRLTKELQSLFIQIQITDYGYWGITKNAAKVKQIDPDVLVERPTVEDIMLAYVERKGAVC